MSAPGTESRPPRITAGSERSAKPEIPIVTVPTPIGDIDAHTAASSARRAARAPGDGEHLAHRDALGEGGFLVEGHGAHGDTGARAEEEEHGDKRHGGGDVGGDPRPIDRRPGDLELLGAPRDEQGCAC